MNTAPGTGYTALLHQSWLQSLLTAPSNLLVLGQVDLKVSTKNCLNQPVTESTDRVPGSEPLLYSASPKPVTEPSNPVHSTMC